ncbi:MAG: hypothetical protein QOD03_409 [Verrucomicrobiota bacterium]|jgi:hypothetical protein
MKVFLVHHSYEVEPCGHDETKLIGIYSTRQSAEAAIERLSIQPGFRDKPEYFSIDEYAIDKDNWTEGYITLNP